MFKKKYHGGLKLFLLLLFFTVCVGFSPSCKASSGDWETIIINNIQYWYSGDVEYSLPANGYWNPEVMLDLNEVPQYNYSLDDYYISWTNVSAIVSHYSMSHYSTSSIKQVAVNINRTMYDAQLKLKDLIFFNTSKINTSGYNQFTNVKLADEVSVLWLDNGVNYFSFGSSGDFISPVLYYVYTLGSPYAYYSPTLTNSGETNLVTYKTTSFSVVNDYYTKVSNDSIVIFSNEDGSDRLLTLMTTYFHNQGDDHNYYFNSKDWSVSETNPFPLSGNVVTPTPTPTPTPTLTPSGDNGDDSFIGALLGYWGETSFSGDTQISSITSNITDSIESFSGDFSSNSIVSTLENFERGFYNLLSERDITKLDFRIFWSDIYFSLFLPDPILLIPSGEVNFSELCRNIPVLGNVQSTIRVIFNFYFFFNLLTYAYNLILTALGIDSPYLLDNPDNPTENLIMDIDSGSETYYRNYRNPHQVLRYITYVRHKR